MLVLGGGGGGGGQQDPGDNRLETAWLKTHVQKFFKINYYYYYLIINLLLVKSSVMQK
jgi:hypothetical protein